MMRYPKGQKEQTRQRILDAASTIFRRQGYQGAGVDAVMKEAGLTHGGFYSHFKNKETMFKEAVEKTMHKIREGRHHRGQGLEGVEWIRAMVQHYLDQNHRQHVEMGCPLPPLVSELGRAGEGPRTVFEQSIRTWQQDIASRLVHLPEAEREDAAIGIISTLVGGMSLARAFRDDHSAEGIFKACRQMIETAFLRPPEPTRNTQDEPDKP